MEDFEHYYYSSVVRGHHVYKAHWTPFIGEELAVAEEAGNGHDPYAVGVLKDGVTVGHVPQGFSLFSSVMAV